MKTLPAEVKGEDVLAGGAALARVLEVLSRDGLVAYPTETFYGLGANAASAAAVDRLLAAKGRPAGMPIPVLVAGPASLDALGAEVTTSARRLMAAFWPGPLTLVLGVAAPLPPRLTAGTGTLGVRVSSHPVAAALAARCPFPLTATSANPSGAREAATPADLDPAVRAAVDLIVDAGRTPGGPASTVLDATVDPPRLLRAGAVPWADVQAALGRPAGAEE